MFANASIDAATLTIMMTIVGTVWSLAWWLSNQFKAIRALVYDKIDMLTTMFNEKLEYHERHDDQRFAAITNDLWAIKLQNAQFLSIEDKKKEKTSF